MSIDAMKQALEALKLIQTDVEWQLNSPTRKFCRKAEISLRQAIEQAEKQEPVAQIRVKNGYWIETRNAETKDLSDGLHNIFTAPPRKEWVGLTDDEVVDAYCQIADETEWAIGGLKHAMPFALAIEKLLKDKNT